MLEKAKSGITAGALEGFNVNQGVSLQIPPLVRFFSGKEGGVSEAKFFY